MNRLRLILVDERGGSSLTPSVLDRLLAGLRQATDARLVTIEGGASAFCTGMDPDALSTPQRSPEPSAERWAERSAEPAVTEDLLRRFASLLEAIERDSRPVIALVDGPALGGGVGIAAAADLVLATPRATFSLPEALLGLIPAMVFPVLARRIGVPRARWLALGAATLSATEAVRVGLVDHLADGVDNGDAGDTGVELEAAFERYAHRLLRMDPRALAEIKRLVAEHQDWSDTYRADAAASFGHLLDSPPTRTRLARFAAGETPWPDDIGRVARSASPPRAADRSPAPREAT